MEKMKLRRTNIKEINGSELSKKTHSENEDPVTPQLNEDSKKSTKRPASPLEDDSLADFKTPKLTTRSNLARNGVKLLENSKNLKPTKTRSNSSRNAKKKSESNQMSIESSLFKPPTAFVCPLCLKSFNESCRQIAHSKNCAVKNRISTRQLIAATELHERQAEERVSIGLPAAPVQQSKRKTSSIKRVNANSDPDIELAIALSKSLSESQELEEFEEAVVIAAASNEKLLEMSSSQRKSTLVNFGFVTNKPAIECVDKPKKRKISGPTVLQTRTEEVRNRLLAERIAEAIVDNVTETQKSVPEDSMSEEKDVEITSFKSEILKEIYRPNCELWNMSVDEKDENCYYVENLRKFIKPEKSSKKINNEDKKLIETDKNITDNQVEEKDEDNSKDSVKKDENILIDVKEKQDSDCNIDTNNVDINIENSCKNEKIVHKLENISVDTEDKKFNEIKLEQMNPLALSWSKMINSKVHSDVIIFLKDKKIIFSHFLVLWTRCREIEKDFIMNNSHNDDDGDEIMLNDEYSKQKQKIKIIWEDIEYQAGIVFLEFIYCGFLINLKALNDCLILYDVKKIATKYKVKELLDFLEEFELGVGEEPIVEYQNEKKDNLHFEKNENKNNLIEENQFETMKPDDQNDAEKSQAKILENVEHQNDEVEITEDDIEVEMANDIEIEKKEINKIDLNNIKTSTKNEEPTIIIISEDESEMPEFQKSMTGSHKNDLLRASYMSVSPDIFDGMDFTVLENSFEKKCQGNKDNNCKNKKNDDVNSDHNLSLTKNLNDIEKIFVEEVSQINEEAQINKHRVSEELIEEKTNTCKNDLVSEKIIEKNIDLIKEDENNLQSTENIVKTRRDISLFIEKVQRRNERFLESDTDEDDSIIMKPKNKRNPFKIVRTSDNDSGLLSKFKQKDLIQGEKENVEIKNKVEKKSALSMFEDDIKARVAIKMSENEENKQDIEENENLNNSQECSPGFDNDVEIIDEQWSEFTNIEKENKNEKNTNELSKSKVVENISENDSSFRSDELIESDIENESMYTRYKKTHRKNSIDKYRDALKNYNNENFEKSMETGSDSSQINKEKSEDIDNFEEFQQSSPEKSSQNYSECSEKIQESEKDEEIEVIKNKSRIRNPRISLINQKNLTELSSFDFYEIEDDILEEDQGEGLSSRENSQKELNSSIDLTASSDEEGFIENKNPIENKKITESRVSFNFSQNFSFSSEKMTNEIELNNKKQDDSINMESDNEPDFNVVGNRKQTGITSENLDSMDWNDEIFTEVNENGPLTQSVCNDNLENEKKNKRDNFCSTLKSNWEMNPPELNWKSQQSNRKSSFTEYNEAPTVTEDVTRILQECGIFTASFQKKDKSNTSIAEIASPIVLSSASDSETDNKVSDVPDDYSFNFGDNHGDNYNDIQGDEKNSVDNDDQSNDEMNFTQFEFEGGANDDFVRFSNHYKSPDHLSLRSFNQSFNKKTSPVISRLSQNSRRSTHSISSSDDENKKSEENDKNSKSRRCSSVSPVKNDSLRLLKTKSQSEGNFSKVRKSLETEKNSVKGKSVGRPRKTHKYEEIYKFLELSPSKVEISFDVVEKECYNQMSSPQLKKKLASFGLKNQERHRAVKLLDFIWDQMHPLVPENLVPKNLDLEDTSHVPKNKIKQSKKNLVEINEESLSEGDEDDKKNDMNKMKYSGLMEFSDDDDDNNDKNKINDEEEYQKIVKQHFRKLLDKDTVLYRKILMYEPIALYIFVDKLKGIGFEVKPKILAKYLDSECITWFNDEPKKWIGGLGKKRKK